MPDKLVKCPRCGKIYAEQPGKSMCARCNTEVLEYEDRILDAIGKRGLRQPEDIAAVTGIPLEAVVELVESSALIGQEIEQERLCVACKERFAQKYCEYCFQCRLTLNKAFGDAVKLIGDIQTRELNVKKEKGRELDFLPSVDDALKHKRGRRVLRRPDPTPKSKYSP